MMIEIVVTNRTKSTFYLPYLPKVRGIEASAKSFSASALREWPLTMVQRSDRIHRLKLEMDEKYCSHQNTFHAVNVLTAATAAPLLFNGSVLSL
jgi:hypothetical protein